MWPIQFLYHGGDTATSVIVILDETRCPALNSLKMVNLVHGVRVPHCSAIFQGGSNK